MGADDRYDTGEVDEHGNPIFRVHNEAVRVLENMEVERAIGLNPRQTKERGDVVYIIAGGA